MDIGVTGGVCCETIVGIGVLCDRESDSSERPERRWPFIIIIIVVIVRFLWTTRIMIIIIITM